MTFKRKRIISALIASGLVISANAFADSASDTANEIQQLRKTIEELDQKIKIIERKNEIAAEDASAAKKTTPVVKAGEDGFSLKSADNQFEYRLKGLAQFDYRTYNGATTNLGATNGFDARLIRPTFEGTLFGKYDFRFTPEFGESDTSSTTTNAAGTNSYGVNKSRIVDAYVDGRFQPWLKVRIGKFTPFVGLERLQANQDTKWVERSYVANNITPTRDLGVSLYGDVWDSKVNYALGVYNGVIDGGESGTGVDTNNNKDLAARVFTTPFKGSDSILEGLGFGLAATYGYANGVNPATNVNVVSATGLPSYKTPGQLIFASYSNTRASGSHIRWVPQAYYYNGPFGLLTEYALVQQEVNGTATNNSTKKASLDNDAWQIAASYLLTGEDASYKGVKPKHAFDTSGSGWGAWEILARYQENNIDSDAFSTNGTTGVRFANPTTNAKSAKTWGIGLNWYLNQYVKIATDYESTNFEGGGGGTIASPTDRPDERILFSRLQLSF